MSKISWPDLLGTHPRAHLVVVTVPEAELLGPELKAAQTTLLRFVRHCVPDGAFASSIVRAAGHGEIHFAFAAEADACKFAGKLRAGVVGCHPDWASQRSANVTVSNLAVIGAALAPPRSSVDPRNLP